MPKAFLILLGTGVALATIGAHPLQSEEGATSVVGDFVTICGGNGQEASKQLPGETIETSEAPRFFGSDLARAGKNHRVTKIDDDFAMRAIMPSHMGGGLILVKCAFASNRTTYDNAIADLTAVAGSEPMEMGDKKTGRKAIFSSTDAPFQLFEERDGWVSIYRMDMMISARDVDQEYLKKGAVPLPMPKAQ